MKKIRRISALLTAFTVLFSQSLCSARVDDPIDLGDIWTIYEDNCETTAKNDYRIVNGAMQCNTQTVLAPFGDQVGYARGVGMKIGDDMSIVYHYGDMDLRGFIARGFMASSAMFYFRFYTSEDGEGWKDITNEVTDTKGGTGGVFSEHVYHCDSIASGSKYLKIAFPNENNSLDYLWQIQLGNVKLWFGNPHYSEMPIESLGETYTDDLSSFEKLDETSSLSGIEIVGEEMQNYRYDGKRALVKDKNAYMVYRVPSDTMSGFCIWANTDDEGTGSLKFWVSNNGTDYTETDARVTVNSPEADGGTYERVYYTDNVPVGSKYLKISFEDAPDNIQIGSAAILYSKLAYYVESKSTETENGQTRVTAVVYNRQEVPAPVTLVAAANSGEGDVIRTKREMLDAGEKKEVTLTLPFEAPSASVFVCDTVSDFRDILSYPYDKYNANVSFSAADNVIKMSGKVVGKGEKYIFMILTSAGISDEVLSKDELTENEITYIGKVDSFTRAGVFNQTFTLPDYVRPGYYNYKVAVSGSTKMFAGSLLISSAEQKNAILEILNDKTKDIKPVFDAEGSDEANTIESLGVNMDGYYKLSDAARTAVTAGINSFRESDTFTRENTAEVINKIIFLQLISDSQNKTQIAERLPLFFEEDGVKNEEYYKKFVAFDSEYKENIYSLILKNKPCADMNEFESAFKDYCVIQEFNAAAYDEFYALFEKYKDTVKLDENKYSRYLNLSKQDRASVGKAMLGETFEAFSEISARFTAAVDAAEQTDNGGSTGGGGTGGGGIKGGGGSSKNSGKQSTAVGAGISSEASKTDITPQKLKFSDIEGVSWAKEAIEYLASKNIAAGDGDGRFRPNERLTREEFVKMIIGALSIELTDYEISFSDVAENEWYTPYIKTAVSESISNGMGDTFGIGLPITRQDIATIACRSAKAAGAEFGGDSSAIFSDSAEISDYAAESVETLTKAGIINGDGNGAFVPLGYATRAEAAKIVYGIMRAIGR